MFCCLLFSLKLSGSKTPGRKGSAGRRIQIEDLLAAGQEGDLPFELGANAVMCQFHGQNSVIVAILDGFKNVRISNLTKRLG